MEIGERFLMLWHQILNHLGNAYLVLRFGSENKKVEGGDWCCAKPVGGRSENFFFAWVDSHPYETSATPLEFCELGFECSRNLKHAAQFQYINGVPGKKKQGF